MFDPISYSLARKAIGKPSPPYSAIVCKDGSTEWAEDANGKTIASGESGVDDASVIQSAIDYAQTVKGKVSCKGEFNVDQTVYVKGGVTLDLTEATIKPIADVDVFYIERDAKVFGGVIDVTGITFTKTIFKLHGEQEFGVTGHSTYIEKVRCINDKATGKVFHLLCENSGEYIVWITISDIMTERFEYVAHIQVTNTTATAFINGNVFDNITDTHSKYMFYLERNTSLAIYESACNSNIFTNFRYQAGSNTSKVIRVQGQMNYFEGKVWDMHVAPSGALAVDLDADSRYTLLIGSFHSPAYVSDEGYKNLIIDQCSARILQPYILQRLGESRYLEYGGIYLRTVGTSEENPPYFLVQPENTGQLQGWAFATKVLSETYPRIAVLSGGRIIWSDGVNPSDVELYRAGTDLLKTGDHFQAVLGLITKVDVGDYGGNFANYTPPTGKEGLMIIAIDTNPTNPGKRLYICANGAWHHVDLT